MFQPGDVGSSDREWPSGGLTGGDAAASLGASGGMDSCPCPGASVIHPERLAVFGLFFRFVASRVAETLESQNVALMAEPALAHARASAAQASIQPDDGIGGCGGLATGRAVACNSGLNLAGCEIRRLLQEQRHRR